MEREAFTSSEFWPAAGALAAFLVQRYRTMLSGQEAVRQSRATIERAEREAISKSQEILLKAKEEYEATRRE